MMEGNQQSNSSNTDCNYEEATNSTQNTMSAQYISLQNICKGVAENTCKNLFMATEFSFSNSCFQ